MSRIIAGSGLLMVALTLIAVVMLHWCWPALEAWQMAPRVAFAAPPDLPRDAYEQPVMWLAHPELPRDPARYLPPGVAHQGQGQAYVFFLHPTTFMGRNHWNAPIDHTDSHMRANLAVRSMASVFNDEIPESTKLLTWVDDMDVICAVVRLLICADPSSAITAVPS